MNVRLLKCLAVALLFAEISTAQERPKIIGVSHLAIYTTDAAKTEYFFVHDLGAVKQTDPENPAGTRYAFNSVQFVEVLPLPADAAPKNRFDHAGFATSDAEAMRAYLKSKGVATPDAVKTLSDGSKLFEVTDPEMNRVEFVQAPRPVPTLAKNRQAVSDHIIHVGYIVHDPAVEDKFYVELLGFRPYWRGGMKDDETQWISQQVPDGTDWLEYMVVKGPEKTGIPADMTQEVAGILDHFALGVQNMEKSVDLLYEGDRLTAKHSPPQIGRDGKWQINLYTPDGTRAELMEFQPSVKPCCSPFLLPSPTQ
jgi:catechol 2,3-dioxygenase-like lactoylglutathione lyase family enzyme